MKYRIESFFWGIIAALGALILELAAFVAFSFLEKSHASLSLSDFFISPSSIIVAAIIEEILKLVIISKQIERISAEKDLLLNSFLVGIGFFAVELSLLALNGLPMPQTRYILEIAVLHAGTAGLIGYSVAIANNKKIYGFFPIVIFTTLLHASYNYLATERFAPQNCLIYAILTIIVILNAIGFFRMSKAAEN